MEGVFTVRVILACIAIVAVGLYAAYVLELFPNQWKCMYSEDDIKSEYGGKCERQCSMCRNLENSQDCS